MTIVANTHMLNIFKSIPLFKLNLGVNFISLKEEKIVIKDPFMIKYLEMTGRQILTYGSIGKLTFYQDYSLSDKEYYIFNDESIYSLKYKNEDSKLKPEDYLMMIIKEITEKEEIKENSEINLNKRTDPDISLPKDQYLQEMLKKRRKQ
jgi:hypothetical protein